MESQIIVSKKFQFQFQFQFLIDHDITELSEQ